MPDKNLHWPNVSSADPVQTGASAIAPIMMRGRDVRRRSRRTSPKDETMRRRGSYEDDRKQSAQDVLR